MTRARGAPLTRAFVDTSALLALLVPTDSHHAGAVRAFERLRLAGAELITSSYVLSEVYALLGRRFGLTAVSNFRKLFAPVLDIVWVDEALHERALDLLASRSRRRLSLVDAVSLVIIEDSLVDEIFAFDKHLVGT